VLGGISTVSLIAVLSMTAAGCGDCLWRRWVRASI
jgi:hypothetical protein